MANDAPDKIKYSFLYDKKALSVFAGLDYALRNGFHIQRENPNDPNMFRFLSDQDNFESLKDYYKDFFRLNLNRDGNDFNQFYYLDMNSDGKSGVPSENREYLKNEYIIIGMLLLKMYRLDGNIELDSVSGFITMLYEEYEEEKNALRKLINDNSSDKGSDLSDQRFEDVVKKAFLKFGELGWLLWDDSTNKDHFKIMPSFERLRTAYAPQIETIDELLKEYDDV
jgi:hypothetical protein